MTKSRIVEITLLITAGIIIILLSVYVDNPDRSVKDEEIIIPHYNIPVEYGIIIDSLLVVKEKVKPNQFLSDILLSNGIGYERMDQLLQKATGIFDARKIRRGNTYALIYSADSSSRLLYFIYEESPVWYVVFDLDGVTGVYRGKKNIKKVTRSMAGVIKTSLWDALVGNNCDPNLANELSEIFAWTIDFFGIQNGDSYKVIYEDMEVEGERIGLGSVKAAQINHMGRDYFAFRFITDSIVDYFDENGGSMRRAFLKAPLRFRRISSGFSYNRLHPILKIYRPHTGVDYVAAYGTPVHAIGDGIITRKGWTAQGGRTVYIKHNGTYTTSYMHLSSYSKGIDKGVRVKQGQVIGYVGKSGLATGPHLDFRFYRNGKAVNPFSVKSPPVRPVDSLQMENFINLKDSLLVMLNEINPDSLKK